MIVNATSAAVTSTDTFKWAYDNWGVDLKSGIYGESKLERQQLHQPCSDLSKKSLRKTIKLVAVQLEILTKLINSINRN